MTLSKHRSKHLQKSKQCTQAQPMQAPVAPLPARRWHWWHYLVVGGVIVLLVWGWLLLQNPRWFPITTVKVEASYRHLEPQQLAKAIAPDAKGDFFRVDIKRLQQRIMKLPWVADAIVRRQWPGTLIIKITEKQAVARWGDNALLDPQGQIFAPKLDTFPQNLPQLYGPNIDAPMVLQQYQHINQLLEPTGLKIAALELSARHAWRMQLTDGIHVEIGSRHIDQRIDHFVQVFPHLFADRISKVASVDLRYPNGLAVSFKK